MFALTVFDVTKCHAFVNAIVDNFLTRNVNGQTIRINGRLLVNRL